jgi:hypothetical protein
MSARHAMQTRRAAVTKAPLADLRKAEQLCVVCGENRRAGSGGLTRCIACIKAAADVDRQHREACRRRRKHARLQPLDVCK